MLFGGEQLELGKMDVVMLCFDIARINTINFSSFTFSVAKQDLPNPLKMRKITNQGLKLVPGNGSFKEILRLNPPTYFQHYIQQPRRRKRQPKCGHRTNFKGI